jgi:ATP-dependent DNA helicase RecQ
LGQAAKFVSSFDRANIYYRVLLKNKDKQQLYDFIQGEHHGEPGIVYVRTRRRADQIASWLQEKGLPAFSYHAGLDPHTRTKRQRQFLHDDGLIIVATIAFGMGIDKPDVRFALCRPFGFAGQHGGILPGDRKGRPGWTAGGCVDGLLPC